MSAHRTGDIEAHLPSSSPTQEKEHLTFPLGDHTPVRAHRGTSLAETMPAPVRLLLTFLVCFLVSFGIVAAWLPDSPATPEQQQEHVDTTQEVSASTMSQILKAVSPGSLHDALHRYLPRYQHGVFESDAAALEAVHRDHKALAAAVVQHLARQDNSTTSSVPPPPPPPPPPTSSTTSSIPTSSSVPPPTTSTTTSIPTSSTIPPVTSSSTSSIPTTPPTPTDPTSSSRTRRQVTSTFTSNVNGVPVIVTSTKFVDGDPHESVSQTRPAPSLHTDAAAGLRHDLGFVFAGAVGAVGMLLA